MKTVFMACSFVLVAGIAFKVGDSVGYARGTWDVVGWQVEAECRNWLQMTDQECQAWAAKRVELYKQREREREQ